MISGGAAGQPSDHPLGWGKLLVISVAIVSRFSVEGHFQGHREYLLEVLGPLLAVVAVLALALALGRGVQSRLGHVVVLGRAGIPRVSLTQDILSLWRLLSLRAFYGMPRACLRHQLFL
jgi:hypothetical protein